MNRKPNYTAPQLGTDGEGGASGSWWIERTEFDPTDRQKTEGKKRYIFKPASREAAVLTGLPPGSGAPREVLAKKLDDIMAGAGFKVGVSPTTLATLDGSHLGGDMDPKSGGQMGSMQRLAPSDGALADSLLSGDTSIVAAIDKRSFDDVAVFDMIYANLDRHSKNVLLRKDEVTGKHALVPIDHGSSLGDPEAIYANRSSLLPPFNIMADPALPQSREPLSQETLESLAQLDPDDMVRQMKKQRADMENRHPGAKGMVDDKAIDAMAARVRFIKEVGPKVSVGELFTLLAYGAKRIADCAPDDIPALAKALIEENKKRVAALGGTKAVREFITSTLPVKNDNNIDNAITNELNVLGWCYSINTSELAGWIEKNPELAERIYKTRMVNPAALREYNRLLPLAKQYRADVEDVMRLQNRNLGESIKFMIGIINGAIYATPTAKNMPADAAEQEFNRLGGEAYLKRAIATFPKSGEDLADVSKITASGERQFQFAKRIVVLRQFADFEALGGAAEYLRLGGEIPRDFKMVDAISRLSELKTGEKERTDLLSKSDQELDLEMTAKYETLRDGLDPQLTLLRKADLVNDARQAKTDAIQAWQNNKRIEGVAILSRMDRIVAAELKAQDLFDVASKERIDAFEKRLAEASPNARQAFERYRQPLRTAFDQAVRDYDKNLRDTLLREAEARLANAEQGPNSPLAQAEAELLLLRQDLAKHVGKPWHGELKVALDAIAQNVAIFMLDGIKVETGRFRERVAAADKLGVALGNAQVTDLPNELQSEFANWMADIRNYSGLAKFDDHARKLTEALKNG